MSERRIKWKVEVTIFTAKLVFKDHRGDRGKSGLYMEVAFDYKFKYTEVDILRHHNSGLRRQMVA